MTHENTAGAAQARSAEHLRLLVESAIDFAVLSLDTGGCYDSWSAGAERILGHHEADALGQHSSLIFTREDREDNQPDKEMTTALRDGRAEDERWHLRKDGSRFWANGVMTPLRDASGAHVGYAKILRDLTERKQSEDALRATNDALHAMNDALQESREKLAASENRLRQAFSIGTVGVLFFTADGRVTQTNDAFLRQSGYTRDDIAAGLVRWDIMTPPEYMPESLNAVGEFLDVGRTTPYVKEYIRKDGSRWWGLFAATRVNADEGVEFAIDVTEQKRAEMELRSSEAALRESEGRFRASEARLRTLSDAVPQLIWTNLATGEADYFNERWYEYSGLSYEESFGLGWQAFVHPDDAPASVERWQQALTAGEVFDTEYRLRRRDGAYRWFIGRNVPLKDEEGRVTGWFGTATDIQELRELREGLEEKVAERTAELAAALSERKALMARVVRAQEEERRRISRDLHDHTGQYMAALAMGLGQMESAAQDIRKAASDAARGAENAARLAAEGAQKAQKAAAEAAVAGVSVDAALLGAEKETTVGVNVDAARQAAAVASEAARTAAIAGTDAGAAATSAYAALAVVDEAAPHIARLRTVANSLNRDVHSLAVTLRPTSLDDLGLVAALTALCEGWAERSGVAPEFVAVGLGEERLPPDVETAVYRVVQEAMTNVAKYSLPTGHTNVSVTLQRVGPSVQAVIEDDGPGFDVEEATKKGRLGLSGMRERAELAGGFLEIESEPGSGTTVFLRVPVSQG
jgi:PAS domain S-box-containing protein